MQSTGLAIFERVTVPSLHVTNLLTVVFISTTTYVRISFNR